MLTYDNSLITEFREDFQIAPYVSDATLIRYANEGQRELGRLNEDADFISDGAAKSLLENYMYYALNHVVSDFWKNYQPDILRWQWHQETEAGDETN